MKPYFYTCVPFSAARIILHTNVGFPGRNDRASWFFSITGLREYFSQTDDIVGPRIPVMVNMTSDSASSKKYQKLQEPSVLPNPSLDQINGANRNSVMMDEYSDEDEEYQIAEPEQEEVFCFFFHILLKCVL